VKPRLQILDASRSRPSEGGPSFTLGNRITRVAWQATWFLFASWTPPPLRPWRRLLLRLFGADVGAHCDVRGSARVWLPRNLQLGARAVIADRVNCYNMALVSLADGALVSQGAHLCTGNHDIDDPHFQLIARPITLEAHSWVAADAFVGPGVVIGEGAVLGARAVAFEDLQPWTLYVGNPAKPRRARKRRGPR
jgi:putative colanic acid biosynthesis acetyltransferase WcaF